MMQDEHVKLYPGFTWKGAFDKKKIVFTSKLDLNLGKNLVMCYIWNIALYGAETWTLRKVDQKYFGKFWNGALEDGDQYDRSRDK
jgi:hypothetical protein